MQINTATLSALDVEFDRRFLDAFLSPQTEPWAEKLATVVQSRSKETVYGLIDHIPGVREWLGPRVAHNLAAHEYTIRNKWYELTVELEREAIEDDTLELFREAAIPGIARQMRKHPDVLLKELLQSTTALGFDGVTFFNNAHPTFDGAGTTYDNLFATTPLTAANLNTVRSEMLVFGGSDGQPLGIVPNLLIVPPQLERTAREINNAAIVATAAGTAAVTNVMQGWFDILVVPELSNQATTWYLAATNEMLKPFIIQRRKEPEFVSRTSPDDPRVFEQKKFLYGADYRGNVGYTLPFLMAKASA